MQLARFQNETGQFRFTPIPETNALQLTLLSPLDVHAHVITLPPLKRDFINSAVEIQITSLFPFTPETGEIDFLLTSAQIKGIERQGGPVLAYVCRREIVEVLKHSDQAFTTGATIIQNFRTLKAETDQIIILASDYWLEYAQWKDNELIGTGAVNFDTDRNWNRHIEHYLPGLQNCSSIQVLAVEGSGDSDNSPWKKLKASLPETVEFFSFHQVAAELRINETRLFKKDNNSSKFPYLKALAVLLLLNLLSGLLLLNALSIRNEQQASALKAEYTYRKNYAQNATQLLSELNSAQTSNVQSGVLTGKHLYRILTAITHDISSSGWINSMTFRESNFQIEVEGTDALSVWSRMNSNPLYINVTLVQATPSLIRGERFVITGGAKL